MPKCILMKSKNVKDKEIIQNASKNKKKKLNTGESNLYHLIWQQLGNKNLNNFVKVK